MAKKSSKKTATSKQHSIKSKSAKTAPRKKRVSPLIYFHKAVRNRLFIAIAVLFVAILSVYFISIHEKDVTTDKVNGGVVVTMYRGRLPCEDCKGVETEITFLQQNSKEQTGTYSKKEVFIGNGEPIITRGTWLLDQGTPDNPLSKVYVLSSSGKSDPEYFEVISATMIRQLDADRKEMQSEMSYQLTVVDSSGPNPAAEYCVEEGLTSKLKTDKNGSKYGVCVMSDERECEEWTYYVTKNCVAPGY